MKQLFVIGMGPGGADQLTPQARRALENSQVLCGYTAYLDLARAFQAGKELVSTPMTQELERCRLALERADAGKTTALICSGDAGVYGMAGPILQMAEEFPEVEVEGAIRFIEGLNIRAIAERVMGELFRALAMHFEFSLPDTAPGQGGDSPGQAGTT